MGMFDYFNPKPPIECSKCGSPTSGWQGKPWAGCGLFVWEQGSVSPVDQRVDDECRISTEQLATRRLETDLIPIYGGECATCGRCWWDSAIGVLADARSGTWMDTIFDPPPLLAVELMPELLQCTGCAEPIDVRPEQRLAYCPTCRRLVVRHHVTSSNLESR
jgi:ssDNA-binding Zn-finger/Zn-ribbon topoisomerase 1